MLLITNQWIQFIAAVIVLGSFGIFVLIFYLRGGGRVDVGNVYWKDMKLWHLLLTESIVMITLVILLIRAI